MMNILTNKKLLWNNPTWVSKSPVVPVFLFEPSTLLQIYEMISERSALGQNPSSWILITIGLAVWLNFYRVICPGELFAIWATRIGVLISLVAFVTASYFKYFY